MTHTKKEATKTHTTRYSRGIKGSIFHLVPEIIFGRSRRSEHLSVRPLGPHPRDLHRALFERNKRNVPPPIAGALTARPRPSTPPALQLPGVLYRGSHGGGRGVGQHRFSRGRDPQHGGMGDGEEGIQGEKRQGKDHEGRIRKREE